MKLKTMELIIDRIIWRIESNHKKYTGKIYTLEISDESGNIHGLYPGIVQTQTKILNESFLKYIDESIKWFKYIGFANMNRELFINAL